MTDGKNELRIDLKAAIKKVAEDRATKSGRACVEAAQVLVDMGELTEARQWVSLAFSADKAKADEQLKAAIKKIEAKGAKKRRFESARRGARKALETAE